jgi:hypothetical protein
MGLYRGMGFRKKPVVRTGVRSSPCKRPVQICLPGRRTVVVAGVRGMPDFVRTRQGHWVWQEGAEAGATCRTRSKKAWQAV